CSGSSQDCEPREETASPVPGTTGVSVDTSLGVAENALPAASTTATYDVSSPAPRASPAARGPLHAGLMACTPTGSPGGGISGHARAGSRRLRRAAPYAAWSSASPGTFTWRGSP